MKRLPLLFFFALALCPFLAHAQNTASTGTQVFEKAQVLEITNQHTEPANGVEKATLVQTLKVDILDGPDHGQTVTFDNDFTQLSVGDTFYIRHTVDQADNIDFWSVSDPYRLDTLALLAFLFVALIFIFGGVQGIRGLASLIGSIALIFYVLIPGILHGYSPILVAIGVASLIIIVGSYITHGFNRTTTAAVLGMIGTVLITGALAYYFIHTARVSGFSNEESVYLNFDTKGTIDMVGLLFGGVMIGLLGVLYDIAIGQAIAIEELLNLGGHLSRVEIYKRGIRIGREHIGALVNTLAIAYVGVSLPLLLLIQSSNTGILFMLNSELFATEIIRILIGSIGLILGVPITTFIAVYMLHGKRAKSASTHLHHH